MIQGTCFSCLSKLCHSYRNPLCSCLLGLGWYPPCTGLCLAQNLERPRYYRTYIMGNEFGELPHFACHGMLVRTHTVQEVLQKRKKNLPADSPGGFGSPLPKEERLLPSL